MESGIIALLLQFLALGVFIALIYPLVKAEKWKEKFWDNPNARALVIVFIAIAIFIALFKLIMHFIVPVEVLS